MHITITTTTTKNEFYATVYQKGIRIKEFNRYIKYGYARIKSFPGTTITQLNNYYSIPTLKEEKPEIVILHVGINDLLF